MEKIIGIKLIDKDLGDGSIITWGNLLKNDETLLYHVEQCSHRRFGITLSERMEFCESLTEIKDHPYFYECLIRFIQEPIPTENKKYEKWTNQKRKALKNRQDIYFTGFKSRYQDYLERKAKGFPDDED